MTTCHESGSERPLVSTSDPPPTEWLLTIDQKKYIHIALISITYNAN